MRKRLCAARKERNLSAADMAKLLGISASYYYKIEKGARNPTLELAARIAAVLDLTIDELFCGTERGQAGAGESKGSCLRPEIAQAWHRCLDYKVDPKRPTFEFLDAEALTIKQIVHRMLIAIAAPWMEYISTAVSPRTHMVVLADAEGWTLRLRGNLDAFGGREHGACPGVLWSEAAIGNNAIGTALAVRKAVSIVGAEHFVHQYRDVAEFGIPLGDGEICGALAVLIRNNERDVDLSALVAECGRWINAALAALAGLEAAYLPERVQALGRLVISTVSELEGSLLHLKAKCERALASEVSGGEKWESLLGDVCQVIDEVIKYLHVYLQTVVADLQATHGKRSIASLVEEVEVLNHWQANLTRAGEEINDGLVGNSQRLLQTQLSCLENVGA